MINKKENWRNECYFNTFMGFKSQIKLSVLNVTSMQTKLFDMTDSMGGTYFLFL